MAQSTGNVLLKTRMNLTNLHPVPSVKVCGPLCIPIMEEHLKKYVMSAMTIKTSSFSASPLFLDISKLRYVNYTVLHQGIYFPPRPPPKKKENTKENIKILWILSLIGNFLSNHNIPLTILYTVQTPVLVFSSVAIRKDLKHFFNVPISPNYVQVVDVSGSFTPER